MSKISQMRDKQPLKITVFRICICYNSDPDPGVYFLHVDPDPCVYFLHVDPDPGEYFLHVDPDLKVERKKKSWFTNIVDNINFL